MFVFVSLSAVLMRPGLAASLSVVLKTVSPLSERLFSPSVAVRGAETRHASELAAFLHFLLFHSGV